MGYKFYTNLVFVKRDYLAANRPIVVGLSARADARLDGGSQGSVGRRQALRHQVRRRSFGLDLKQQTRQNELQYAMLKSPTNADLPLLSLDRDAIGGPDAAAKASGRDKLPEVDKLCDFTVMQEVHASLKKS